MRLEFGRKAAQLRGGTRYTRVRVLLDGSEVGYIEGLDETYIVHMPSGGEVGPYPSLAAAKRAVQAGLRRGVLGRTRH